MSDSIQDGFYFKEVAEKQEKKLLELCELTEQYLELEKATSDNIKGAMRAAVGQARLIVAKKFPQFYGLCQRNLTPTENEPAVKVADLEGFWDLMMLEVKSINRAFQETAAAVKEASSESADSCASTTE